MGNGQKLPQKVEILPISDISSEFQYETRNFDIGKL